MVCTFYFLQCKCSGSLLHDFTVESKKECKYELPLADGILNLCACPLVEVDSGIKLIKMHGITANPLIILYNMTNLR